MQNYKIITVYVLGMLTLATILIGADLYSRKMDSACFNQSAPIQDISDLAGGQHAN